MKKTYPSLYLHDVGDRFQRETSYHPEKTKGHSLDWSQRPEVYKNVEAPLGHIPLPEPSMPEAVSLWDVIMNRRSRRQFAPHKTMTLQQVSTLLWAGQGITAQQGDMLLRTTPSAGALYTIETYFYAQSVSGLDRGFYHFRPRVFDLEFMREGDYTSSLAEAALKQSMVKKAQITFIWSAVIDRAKWKYKDRAYRYMYLDAGHIAQNLYLAAEALGLGMCVIGAFYDESVNCLIGIDGMTETAVYMAVVGWPA